VDDPPGALGGVRIVRDHHDGLAVVAIESLEQVQNLIAGFAIEVARRLIAQEQRGIVHDGSSNAGALFLAPGELPRVVPRAIGQARAGAAVSAVLFAIVHFSVILAPFYATFALVMCWLLVRTGTLAAPIAAHMTMNGMACVALLLADTTK